MVIERADGRLSNQLRPLQVTYDVFEYAPGSVLFKQGRTKILCAVTLQPGVPPFLRGKGEGWLTAEYAMLPASTGSRIARDASTGYKNGRSVEISRFLGRSLRSIIDTKKLGERTIMVDCDVLQADGSTRTACITAASLALEMAVQRWLRKKMILESILTDHLVGVSVGLHKGQPLLDLTFFEDSSIDVDFNFVFTHSQKVVEMQATAEMAAFSWEQFEQVKTVAFEGMQKLVNFSTKYAFLGIKKQPMEQSQSEEMGSKDSAINTEDMGLKDSGIKPEVKKEKVPLFSLQNRTTTPLT